MFFLPLCFQVRHLKGIGELVNLFNCDNQEVQRYATGATRNLIYENMDNKVALIEEGGILQLVEALKDSDEELNKNITGRKIAINLIKLKKKKKNDTTSKIYRNSCKLAGHYIWMQHNLGSSVLESEQPLRAILFTNKQGIISFSGVVVLHLTSSSCLKRLTVDSSPPSLFKMILLIK